MLSGPDPTAIVFTTVNVERSTTLTVSAEPFTT